MIVQTYNLSPWEVEGRLRVQSYPQLHRKFEAILSNIKS